MNVLIRSVRAFSFLEFRHLVSVSDKKMAGFDTMLAVKKKENRDIIEVKKGRNIYRGR